MLVTRGLGPAVTIASFGFGPSSSLVAVVGDIVRGLIASFIAIGPAMQAPVQLTSLEIMAAGLEPNLSILEALVDAGLLEDTASVQEALHASVSVEPALQSDDGSPEVG